jgi:hypothetical protein
MTPEGLDALMKHPAAQQEVKRKLAEYEAGKTEKLEARQVNTGLVPGVVSLLNGTLTAVYDNVLGLIPTADSVKGLQKFPEAAYPFQAPGPTDQRGPCPGLNTLANHGCK